jgi:AraC-like DNA-binding protein
VGSLIRATNLAGYDDLVRALGGDPDPLRERFGLPPGVEHDEDAFVPYAPVSRLMETTAEELACPDLGLRLSAAQGLAILGPVAVIARNAATVLDAFVAVGRYLHVHSPALRLWIAGPDEAQHGRGTMTFRYAIEERGLPYSVQSYELSLANGTRILRLLAGPEAHWAALAFRHPRHGPQASYDETLGPAVLFDQDWCGFALTEAEAQRPIDNADPATLRLVTRFLEDDRRAGEDLAPRVAELVRRLLPTGTCRADAVADHLGLHPRTLQRRLAGEETTFAAIVEAERAAQALRLLANPGLPLRQVAGLLGYTEQSTFNRSFRRWHGTTPASYRRSS